MRRLARRLVTPCAAASLVLCVAACALWARSHRVTDEWMNTSPGRRLLVTSHAGVLVVEVHDEVRVGQFVVAGDEDAPDGAPQAGRWERRSSSGGWQNSYALLVTESHGSGWNRVGFIARDQPINLEMDVGHGPETFWLGRLRCLAVPYWAVVIPAGVLALPLLRRAVTRVRRGRRRPGYCPCCGYDLRATPGRCPECGAAAARGTA